MSNSVCKPKDKIDTIDLKIIRCLSRDCRASYRDISSIVGITPNAVKERINMMICNGIIQSFRVNVNPVLFGYEKECFLTVKHFYKKTTRTTISEDDIIKQLNLLGDVKVYAKLLQGSARFAISLRPGAEDKIGLVSDLLKQSALFVVYEFMNYRPISMKVHSSDFKIIKSLLSNPRMRVEDIAKETSLSTKTVTRRLEKLRENHIVEFGVIRDMSSMQLRGYIEFGVMINLKDDSFYRYVLERIYQEMQEYLFVIPHFSQKEGIFLVFFCPNISTVDLILRRLESYEGVNGTEMFITTKLVYYQDWIKREIDKRLRSEEEEEQWQQQQTTISNTVKR
jgi:DNA-binding Lrp family transcriptional regulator